MSVSMLRSPFARCPRRDPATAPAAGATSAPRRRGAASFPPPARRARFATHRPLAFSLLHSSHHFFIPVPPPRVSPRPRSAAPAAAAAEAAGPASSSSSSSSSAPSPPLGFDDVVVAAAARGLRIDTVEAGPLFRLSFRLAEDPAPRGEDAPTTLDGAADGAADPTVVALIEGALLPGGVLHFDKARG